MIYTPERDSDHYHRPFHRGVLARGINYIIVPSFTDQERLGLALAYLRDKHIWKVQVQDTAKLGVGNNLFSKLC